MRLILSLAAFVLVEATGTGENHIIPQSLDRRGKWRNNQQVIERCYNFFDKIHKAYLKLTYSDEHIRLQTADCAISLETDSAAKFVAIQPCNHKFLESYLKEYQENNRHTNVRCPLCRGPINSAEKLSELEKMEFIADCKKIREDSRFWIRKYKEDPFWIKVIYAFSVAFLAAFCYFVYYVVIPNWWQIVLGMICWQVFMRLVRMLYNNFAP